MTRQAQLAHQLGHVSLMVTNTPASLDLAAELGQGPGREAGGFNLWTIQNQLAQLAKLIFRQLRFRSATWTVVQTSQTLGIVAHHGVAQGLPLHACQSRRLRSGHPLQGVGDRLHPRRRTTIRLPPGATAELG